MIVKQMLSGDVQERFRELARQIDAGGFDSSKPWIEEQWRLAATPKGCGRMLRYWNAVLAAGGAHPYEQACLDAGCGAGMLPVILSLVGASRVVAVDILPEAVRVTQEIVSLARLPNVVVVQGDVAELPGANETFNLVYSVEAISHYKDYRAFLRHVWALLAKGGVLVIRDANNGANPDTVRKTRAIWHAFEHGYPSGTCFGHQPTPDGYLGSRRRILHMAMPHLQEKQLEQYSRWTFGYNREQVIAAARLFAVGDFSMKSEFRSGACPLDPEENMLCEQLFHPYVLAREMESIGFKVSVRSHLADRYPIADALWGWLSPLTIGLSGGFVIVARKI
jgi:2-polyprenyl-3-methyl-5-hydroxy-6-metoxy-1,4-benzoquinol methylase